MMLADNSWFAGALGWMNRVEEDGSQSTTLVLECLLR